MFEYLDHTADVQIHSWGASLEESFAETAYAIIDYMTCRTDIEPLNSYTISINARDIQKLLYQFLDQILFHFYVDNAAHDIQFEVLHIEDGFYKLEAVVRGEPFDGCKHRCRCEVKAITYSNMSISQNAPYDIFVIIDV